MSSPFKYASTLQTLIQHLFSFKYTRYKTNKHLTQRLALEPLIVFVLLALLFIAIKCCDVAKFNSVVTQLLLIVADGWCE